MEIGGVGCAKMWMDVGKVSRRRLLDQEDAAEEDECGL